MRNIGYLEEALNIILTDVARSQRSIYKNIFVALYLRALMIYKKIINFLKDYKDLKDVVAFLAFVFEVEIIQWKKS